uniref:Leukotriene B4 receptor 2b n=1 Tax=Neogobius melanostomus TaxID=47308 RepID=A0A8C6STD0_9GOBI
GLRAPGRVSMANSLVSNDVTTTLGALILGLVFLLGVPGNLFVVWSIMARIRRHSVTSFLILNLASILDFWDSHVQNRVLPVQHHMYASIFLITLMSVHRLVAVVLPTKFRSSPVRGLRSVLWWDVGASLYHSIPSLVFRNIREDDDEMGRPRMVCTPNHTISSHVRFQYAFETVAGFILPYAVIITSYVLILRRLRQTKFQRKIRSEKLILAIVVTFGLFWLPYHVINMIQVHKGDILTTCLLDLIWRSSRAVTSALAFISSCANPVLYTFAGKSYIRRTASLSWRGSSTDRFGHCD